MTTGDDGAAELARIESRREELRGFLAATREELSETAVTHELLTLRKELLRIEDAIRVLNQREFALKGKIHRVVGANEVKCPACGRYLVSGTILSPALRAALVAAQAAAVSGS